MTWGTTPWEPWGSYAMRTATHSIAKYRVRGEPLYVLWLLPDTRLGKYRSFQAAKAAASIYANIVTSTA